MSSAWTSLTWSQNKQKFQVWDGRDRWYLYIKWLPRPGLPAPATVRQTAGELLMKFKTFLVSWVKTECWWWEREEQGPRANVGEQAAAWPASASSLPCWTRYCYLIRGRHEQYFCSAQDSLPAMSAMIDTETSVNHLVEHAANRKKLGKVQCEIFANLRLKL